MNNTGPSSLNIVNPIQTIGATGVNFIGNGVTMSGTWYLGGGSSAINIRNNGVGTTVTLAGAMSGTSGTVTYSGANGGKIILSGANTYTGPTAVGVSGDTNVRLVLGAANTIASSSKVIMAGGTLDPDGFTHAMQNTTLSLTANSMIDYGAGPAELEFANSSSLSWSGVLDLANWNPDVDILRVGDDATGLTPAQLADIEANGGGLGTAQISPQGFVYVIPEPSAALLGLLGGMGLLWSVRRRTA
jgi:hypothetical protein